MWVQLNDLDEKVWCDDEYCLRVMNRWLKQGPYLTDLPPDVVELILEHLEIADQFSLVKTSKKMRDVFSVPIAHKAEIRMSSLLRNDNDMLIRAWTADAKKLQDAVSSPLLSNLHELKLMLDIPCFSSHRATVGKRPVFLERESLPRILKLSISCRYPATVVCMGKLVSSFSRSILSLRISGNLNLSRTHLRSIGQCLQLKDLEIDTRVYLSPIDMCTDLISCLPFQRLHLSRLCLRIDGAPLRMLKSRGQCFEHLKPTLVEISLGSFFTEAVCVYEAWASLLRLPNLRHVFVDRERVEGFRILRECDADELKFFQNVYRSTLDSSHLARRTIKVRTL